MRGPKLNGQWKMVGGMDSSGEGRLVYDGEEGTLEFPFFQWGAFIHIPPPELWAKMYGESWAAGLRDTFILTIIANRVPSVWPSAEIQEKGIQFYNPEDRETEREKHRAEARRAQAPGLDEFLRTLSDHPDIALFVISADRLVGSVAECTVSDVFRGSPRLRNARLQVSFDRDVPLIEGRLYLTSERDPAILQYVNTTHIWRCLRHVELDAGELARAKQALTSN